MIIDSINPHAAQAAQAACPQYHSRRRKEDSDQDSDYRPAYRQDVDSIVHAKAYARYSDKTQVAYLVRNDHITHRSLHVQLVSHFARGIAEPLGLNLALVEAIALGHDIGHPPFGHEGEGYLNALAKEHGLASFSHPWQSCRLFSIIEPLNLTLAVYDGFLCHDGGLQGSKLMPAYGKGWEQHESDLWQKEQNPEANIMPSTLEGCLVKLCDTVSYLARDIEDAIAIGIIVRKAVPMTPLGQHSREILKAIAQDLIKESIGKDHIALSEEVYEALQQLRTFNFEKIYVHPRLKQESCKIEQSYRLVFEWLLSDYGKKGHDSYIWKHFLHNKPKEYLDATGKAQFVVDYMAGMTDSYFVHTVEKLFVPHFTNMYLI